LVEKNPYGADFESIVRGRLRRRINLAYAGCPKAFFSRLLMAGVSKSARPGREAAGRDAEVAVGSLRGPTKRSRPNRSERWLRTGLPQARRAAQLDDRPLRIAWVKVV